MYILYSYITLCLIFHMCNTYLLNSTRILYDVRNQSKIICGMDYITKNDNDNAQGIV